jgi:hypothetical protein
MLPAFAATQHRLRQKDESGPGTVRLPPESAKEYVRTRFPAAKQASEKEATK